MGDSLPFSPHETRIPLAPGRPGNYCLQHPGRGDTGGNYRRSEHGAVHHIYVHQLHDIDYDNIPSGGA